jgi:hypothetical protein
MDQLIEAVAGFDHTQNTHALMAAARACLPLNR